MSERPVCAVAERRVVRLFAGAEKFRLVLGRSPFGGAELALRLVAAVAEGLISGEAAGALSVIFVFLDFHGHGLSASDHTFAHARSSAVLL
jgi:hypothetical protein